MEIIFTKQDESCTNIEDVIEKKSGTSIKAIIQPNIFPDIPGIKEFVSMLHGIRARKQSVRVIGDYDADGITSTTIAFECLTEFLGYPITVRFPKRFSEGYGMKMHMVQEAPEDVHIATIHLKKRASHSSKKYQKITIILTNYVDKTLESW